MNIDLKQFLDIVTYDGLFDNVMLPHSLGAPILFDDPEHKICFIESFNSDKLIVWYPIQAWINERKRRNEILEISKDCHRNKIPTPVIKKVSPNEITKRLLEAIQSGNSEEAERISKLL